MSLAHYLALGKSIENFTGDHNRKVTSQPATPDFSLTKNPTASKSLSSLEILNLFDQTQMPVMRPPAAAAASAPFAVVQAATQTQTANSGRRTRWWHLGDFRKNRTNAGRQAVAIQRELALDAVRPVRNDLSESDLEAVPVTAPPAAQEPRVNGLSFWRWPLRFWTEARAGR